MSEMRPAAEFLTSAVPATDRPTSSHPTSSHPTGGCPGSTPGRHRRAPSKRVRLTRAVNLAGRVGSLVTLAALLVLAGAIGGLVDGTPVTVTATFGTGGR